jgi:hypothetical protein
MTIEPCTNPKVIKQILSDPELWERISQSTKIDDWEPCLDIDNSWFACWEGGEPIGCFLFEVCNESTIEIHINILKQYREEFSYKIGCEIIKLFSENPVFDKMIAAIPECCKDVYQYTIKFGFINEGINRLSIKKNGKLVNQIMLGITKSEAALWVQLKKVQNPSKKE